jgi:hypothetical protein
MIPNVTHFMPGVGKLSGRVLLTPFRLLFEAHDRSSYADTEAGQVEVPLRTIHRLDKLDEGENGRFLQIACRNFQVFVFCFESARHSRNIVFEWLARQQEPWALIAPPPALIPARRERGWLEEQYRRVFFPGDGWRVSEANAEFQLCASYPELVVMPASVTDEMVQRSSSFRSKNRFLAAVWCAYSGGPSLSRCSQPLVGLGSKRNADDEAIVAAIGASSGGRAPCLIDSRPLAVAVANKVKGAGSETVDCYEGCEMRFIGIPNMHALRDSWNKLKALCQGQQAQDGWLVAVHNTEWLSHVQRVLEGSATMAKIIHRDKRSCITHCSDGWDRTSQLCSLTQLMLDPYFRTLEGFPKLIHKEWLCFGHRFQTRSGTGASPHIRETSPVFLLFLDCVWQMQRQFCASFEFGETYLTILLDATYSGQFGTFLFDSVKERQEINCDERTGSVWDHLEAHRDELRNPLYTAGKTFPHIPSTKMSSLGFWSRVYLRLKYEDEREKGMAMLSQKLNK